MSGWSYGTESYMSVGLRQRALLNPGDLLLSGGPEDYEYLKHSRLSVEGVDDHEEWRALQVGASGVFKSLSLEHADRCTDPASDSTHSTSSECLRRSSSTSSA